MVNRMVNRSARRLDRTLRALAHSTRRSILASVAREASTVGELAAPFGASLPAISRHLRVLERAGLLRRDRHGREHLIHLVAAPLEEVAGWVETYRSFWETRLDRLAELLEKEPAPSRKGAKE